MVLCLQKVQEYRYKKKKYTSVDEFMCEINIQWSKKESKKKKKLSSVENDFVQDLLENSLSHALEDEFDVLGADGTSEVSVDDVR